MARKIGFGGSGRRSVLNRAVADAPAPPESPQPMSQGGGKAAIFLGFALLYAVPLLFVAIGAWPLLGAMSFPQRAHEAQATITGWSAVQEPGQAERVTSYTVKYATRIGARLTAEVEADGPRESGEQIVVFYDPDAPRYIRRTREVSFSQALDRVGDRIYFAYFGIAFDLLVTVALVMFLAQSRKRP